MTSSADAAVTSGAPTDGAGRGGGDLAAGLTLPVPASSRASPGRERAGGRDDDLSAGPPLATPERITAAEAAAARLEGEIQHLRDTLGHVDELVSATNRHRRLRTLIVLLQREKRAAEARAEREHRDVQFEAAAERARAVTAALLADLEAA